MGGKQLQTALYPPHRDRQHQNFFQKAAGQQHGAGVLPREGFDISEEAANQDNYNKLKEWISEGAENN